MQKSKLIDILRTFSKEEIKEFGKFVESPFFSTGRDVSEFFLIIKKYYPDFNGDKLDKEKIYTVLYPGEIYKDHIIRNLASVLMKHAENFLIIKNLYKSPENMSINLLSEFVERKASNLSELEIKRLEKILSEKNNLNEKYYRNCLDLESMKVMLNIQTNKQHLVSKSILKQGELIISNFLIDSGTNITNIMNDSSNFNAGHENNVLRNFLSSLDMEFFVKSLKNLPSENDNIEILEMYTCLIITLMNETEEKYYFRMKELLNKNISKLSRAEKYNVMVNFGTCTSQKMDCISRKRFLKELFNVYKTRLANNLYAFSDTQHMSLIFFSSIMKMSLALGEHKWLEQFAEENIPKLAPEHLQNMKSLVNSYISFNNKLFEKALASLSKVHFELFTLKYDVKNLVLQIYYELGEIEQALYQIDSYRHFLSENKAVSGYFREANLKFINAVNELIKVKLDNTGSSIIDLKKTIEEYEFFQQSWLKEKVFELENFSKGR